MSIASAAQSLPQPVRFLIAGGFAAAVNWLARFPISLVVPFVPAVAIATAIGMIVGFVAYRSFVYPGSRRSLLSQLRDFLLINALTAIAVVIVAAIAKDPLLLFVGVGTAEALAHAIGIAVGACLNYLGHGIVTFRHRGDPQQRTVRQ